MPTFYVRKCPSRGSWTQEDLNSAIDNISRGVMNTWDAAKNFNIPYRTLKRRVEKNNTEKKRLGPDSLLGEDAENKLVTHIKKLQRCGFSPTATDVREMAFLLGEKLNRTKRFNLEKRKAGYDWLHAFLKRHPDLSVRKAEGVSRHRALGMNKETVGKYFDLLSRVLEENDLLDKPSHIYNMDETGLQLNNKPGMVLAEKGSKAVVNITAQEKGENITVVACCNAEGQFLPPVCIFKGKNKKSEFEDNMPPGSVVYMSQKSAYINSELFFIWFRDHFVPRKVPGKVVLILDGHGSHCNSVETLEYAEANNVILLCLPPHTTHYLQPLDRSVFKSLKAAYYQACQTWVKSRSNRTITRLHFGQLLNDAWGKAASVQNAVSGFKSTGIFPLSPQAIPEYAFMNKFDNRDVSHTVQTHEAEVDSETSTNFIAGENDPQANNNNDEPDTPGKILNALSPIPEKIEKGKGRNLKIAELLTSEEHIESKRKRAATLIKKEEIKKAKSALPKNAPKINEKNNALDVKPGVSGLQRNKANGTDRPGRKKKNRRQSESSTDESFIMSIASDSESDLEEENECCCQGCGEEYTLTKKKDDWLQCVHCKQWLHESCSKYQNICEKCSKFLCTIKK